MEINNYIDTSSFSSGIADEVGAIDARELCLLLSLSDNSSLG